MQLVQKGKPKLEDTLAKVMPDFPFPERKVITIQHLLNHSSGLGDYMEHEHYTAKMSSITSISDILPLIYNRQPLSPAGERCSYSNSGMVLLGAVIEKVSGMSYTDYLQQLIFSPPACLKAG